MLLQDRKAQTAPQLQGKQRRRRGIRVVVIGAVCLALLAAVFATARYWAPQPTPYGGPATARDILEQVVADPSGGVWAVGTHLSGDLDKPNSVPASTFVLHLEQGHWVTRYTFSSDSGRLVGHLAMTSADEGWAVGTYAGGNVLIVHLDHGSWSEADVHPGGQLLDIAMASSTEGWAVGGTIGVNPLPLLLHYRDGTWTQVASPAHTALQSIVMASPSEGWAAGPGDLLHFSGGVWTDVTPSSQVPGGAAFAMTSPTNGWMVGQGRTLHYDGTTWNPATTPSLNLDAISMASPSEGWAVGDVFESGTCVLLHYSGGAWMSVSCPSAQPLMGVAMVSPSEGWAVGLAGTILHYSNGTWSVVNGGV